MYPCRYSITLTIPLSVDTYPRDTLPLQLKCVTINKELYPSLLTYETVSYYHLRDTGLHHLRCSKHKLCVYPSLLTHTTVS